MALVMQDKFQTEGIRHISMMNYLISTPMTEAPEVPFVPQQDIRIAKRSHGWLTLRSEAAVAASIRIADTGQLRVRKFRPERVLLKEQNHP